MNSGQRLLLGLLYGYKTFISPWLPRACRFTPTCSEYAAQAIEQYGARRGAQLTLWRLLRCHPFSRGGLDPLT